MARLYSPLASLHSGRSALHSAVYNDDLDMIRLLAAAGAKAQLADSVGCTPLITAAEMGHERSAQALLEYDSSCVALMDHEVSATR